MAGRLLFIAILFRSIAAAQKPEYDFYPEFRHWSSEQAASSTAPLTRQQIAER